MYKTQVDLLRNRAQLTLKGKLDVPELQAWSADLLAQLKKLRTGFSVISDILECQPTTEEGRQIIQDTQRKAKEMGMGPVVRVKREINQVTANQWQRSSRAVGYTASEAGSVEDASKLLDEILDFRLIPLVHGYDCNTGHPLAGHERTTCQAMGVVALRTFRWVLYTRSHVQNPPKSPCILRALAASFVKGYGPMRGRPRNLV